MDSPEVPERVRSRSSRFAGERPRAETRVHARLTRLFPRKLTLLLGQLESALGKHAFLFSLLCGLDGKILATCPPSTNLPANLPFGRYLDPQRPAILNTSARIRKEKCMPLLMDIHAQVEDLTQDAVCHAADLKAQKKYLVKNLC